MVDKNLEYILVKRALSDYLGFLKYKVDNDVLTLEEEQSMIQFLERSLRLSATAEDLAGYYGKTPTAVRSIIHRKLLSKPRRRVMYDFREFSRIIPDKWKK